MFMIVNDNIIIKVEERNHSSENPKKFQQKRKPIGTIVV
jgi:hypothetical protein